MRRAGLDQADGRQRERLLLQPGHAGKRLVPALHGLHEIGGEEGVFLVSRRGRRRLILLQRVLREGQ